MFDRLFKSEHQRIEEMLSAYLDGELSPKEKTRVEKHLAQCAACAQNLHTLRQTVALLGQLAPVAVPRAFALRPAQVAQRPSVFQARRSYGYLRAATVLATILFAVVVAGDAFLTGLAPYLAPARAPEVIEREVPVEKVVVETVVVEKKVPVTVEVEKEVVVEKEAAVEAPTEAPIVESKAAYAATATPAPAKKKDELALTQKPLPTPAAVGTEIPQAAAPPATPERGALAEAPPSPGEEQIEATAIPTPSPGEAIIAAEPTFMPPAMPTAIAEVLLPTPTPQEPTSWTVARPGRLGLTPLRAVEAGLLLLVLVLAVATLVARRRQRIR